MWSIKSQRTFWCMGQPKHIMKKFLLGSMITLISLLSFGQENENVPDLIPYEDALNKMFVSKVIEIPNKTQKELVTQFKNWASTSFVNLKEVIVSETDNQIVLNYITKTGSYFKILGAKNPYFMNWYVRVVAQFKDGKMRIQFYDDGNVYKPSQYTGISSTSDRSVYISYMTNKPESVKELHKSPNFFYELHYQWQQNVSNMLMSCEKGMKDVSLIVNNDF